MYTICLSRQNVMNQGTLFMQISSAYMCYIYEINPSHPSVTGHQQP